MRRTTTLALTAALAAALALPTTGAALAAPRAKPTASPTAGPTATTEPTAEPTATPTDTPTATPTATSTGAPAPRVTRGSRGARNVLVVNGTVSAVDAAAGTLTVTVRGGRDKSLRGKELVVAVAESAKIVRDDAAVELAEIAVGDHVSVKGTRGTAGPTATRVSADSGDEQDGGDPTATPTTEPTASPTTEPAATPTVEPTTEPTTSPTA
ncbi:hypothetical protein [Kineococcus auxinigenes]|uniref:hypothetical protein n=1 Tax=unclassified Kineococcus TaxID=2621656 RepID=UPI003D7CB737